MSGMPLSSARSWTRQILLRLDRAERAAEHGEVLREDRDAAAVDLAEPGDDAVARVALVGEAEGGHVVRRERAELLERPLVEQQREPFPRGELPLRVLLRDPVGSAPCERLLALLLQPDQVVVHARLSSAPTGAVRRMIGARPRPVPRNVTRCGNRTRCDESMPMRQSTMRQSARARLRGVGGRRAGAPRCPRRSIRESERVRVEAEDRAAPCGPWMTPPTDASTRSMCSRSTSSSGRRRGAAAGRARGRRARPRRPPRSPRARTQARSITLCSSRTFPGHA